MQLISEGRTYQAMADALGVAKLTIHYELQRIIPYNPELAQLDADTKRKACGHHSILTPDQKHLIENHLRLTWSPEMIANAFNFATASIYRWLYTGRFNFNLTDLPNRNVYQKHSKEKRGTL